MPSAVRDDPEHREQVALFQWIEWMAKHDPRFECIFAIPNGGERPTPVAVKMQREGVKAGVHDIFVAVPKELGRCTADICIDGRTPIYNYPLMQYAGLFIEMKHPGRENEKSKGYLTRGFSDYQLIWATRLAEQGYLVAGAWSMDEAKALICDYLGVKG